MLAKTLTQALASVLQSLVVQSLVVPQEAYHVEQLKPRKSFWRDVVK